MKYFDGDNVRECGLGGASNKCGDRRRAYSILFESLKERDQLRDLGADGHIILECILGKALPNFILLTQGQTAGSFEHDDDGSSSTY